MTDQELINEFVAVVNRNEKTLHKYRKHLEECTAWLDRQGVSLLTARHRDLVRFLAYLASDQRLAKNSYGQTVKKKLGPSSRKGVIAALRAFYKHCIAMEYTERNPTAALETPRVPIKRGITIGKREIRQFLDARGRPRCRVQGHLFTFTAARLATIAGLRWPDIDFAGNMIHFRVVKGDESYTLPMHPELRAALLRWRSEQLEQAERNERIAEALASDETAFVLLTTNGKPVSKTTLAKQLKWRAARVNLLTQGARQDKAGENKSKLSPHAIRRSVATMLRNEGKPLEDIADLLHHKDLNVTRTYYAHVDTPHMRKTVNDLRF
jgi:integrase/recombinase XerD